MSSLQSGVRFPGQHWKKNSMRYSEALFRYALLPSLFVSGGRYTGEMVLLPPRWNGMDAPEALLGNASAILPCFPVGSGRPVRHALIISVCLVLQPIWVKREPWSLLGVLAVKVSQRVLFALD